MNALIRITRHVQLKGTNLNFLRYLNYQKISNSFIPLTQVSCINNSWIYQRNQPEIPLIIDGKIDLPNNIKIKLPLIDEPITKKEIEAPATANSDISKQTARLIVIRRKKMKKHKLKKLRKRMKFEWAKIRQRRELKKEKAFQAILIQQCKEAEAFSAEKYVQERIDKFNEIMLSKNRKEKKISRYVIEKMGPVPRN